MHPYEVSFNRSLDGHFSFLNSSATIFKLFLSVHQSFEVVVYVFAQLVDFQNHSVVSWVFC
jgi:hypothetical protein